VTVFTEEEHLDNLVRHVNLVRESGVLLGRRLMSLGHKEFGRILIGNVYVHDASKFSGIEWDYLHAGKDVPKECLDLAVKQHVHTNSHHPEFWGGFENTPKIAIYEMTCDWYARSQEFGTCLRDWIRDVAVARFRIKKGSDQQLWLTEAVDLLLEDSFVRA
jgi:hypothetical protein